MSTGLWLGEAANLLFGGSVRCGIPRSARCPQFFPPAAGPVKTFEPDQVTEQGEWELRRDANIGQISMLITSSLCDPYGALWGYDFVRPPSWPPLRGCSRPKNGDQFDPERRERILNGPLRVSGAR